MAKSKINIAIIGTFPPPYGGVSIHLKRILPYINNSNFNVRLYNTGQHPSKHPLVHNVGKSLIKLYSDMVLYKPDIIHFHTSQWYVRFFAALLKIILKSKLIFTCHGASILKSLGSNNIIIKSLSGWAINKADILIATNEYIKKELIIRGVSKNVIHVIPAFIPPVSIGSREDIPVEVRYFCENKFPILVANGAFVTIDNKDVYGLSFMLELINNISKIFPDIALIVYMRAGAESKKDKYSDLIKTIRTTPTNNHMMLFESKDEFCSIFNIADVFLRPTTTDGDSNSVREALFFGIPVVASNVIPRPEGCILFESENQNDFTNTVCSVISNIKEEKFKTKLLRLDNPAEMTIKLYSSIIN